MKYTIYAGLLLSMAFTIPAFANEIDDTNESNQHEQGIGFGTGSIAGGFIAGPPGIIAGALIGSLIGQNISDEHENKYLQNTNNDLEKELAQKDKQLNTLNEEYLHNKLVLQNTHLTIERLIQQNQELKNHALNFDVQFRTNSYEIEKQYQKYLIDLASALTTTPNMEVEVAGYADRTGEEEYNLELSIERAKQVKGYLISHGIDEARITTLAFGESQPLHPEENLENNFFDRRVSIYLRPIEVSTENIAKEIAKTESLHDVISKL